MALTKQEKKEIVAEYANKLSSAEAFFIINPKGVTPSAASEFKKQLNEKQATFNVVKNTLFKIALKEAKKEIELSEGENAILFSGPDAVDVAKILSDFIKANETTGFRSGLVEGKIIDQTQFQTLSNLPSREVLLGQLLSVVNGPATGFVRVLNGNLQGFMTILNRIKDQKQA